LGLHVVIATGQYLAKLSCRIEPLAENATTSQQPTPNAEHKTGIKTKIAGRRRAKAPYP
jgi:hypothetical protein